MAGERRASVFLLAGALSSFLSIQGLFYEPLRPLDPLFGPLFLILTLYGLYKLRHTHPGVIRVFIYGCCMGFVFEVLGVNFCVPFGCYHYVRLPGILCGVPPGVVLMWGIYITIALLACNTVSKTMLVLRAILATVAIDVAMEPVMVSRGCWVWESGWGPWFNKAPLSNYVGWGVVALTALLLARIWRKPLPRDNLFVLCYLVYLAVWWFTPYTRISAVIASLLLATVGLMPWGSLRDLMCSTSRQQA